MLDVTEAVLELLRAGEGGALATVVHSSGSTPQQAGARLLLRRDGSTLGTVGGGAVERVVTEALRQVLEDGSSQLRKYDLARDLGMCCGGSMQVFVECLPVRMRLWLFGAGHVALPTASLARSVGFEVTVLDEREALCSEERFAGCQLESRDPAQVLRQAKLGRRDWVLVVTHDHQLDEELLRLALATDAHYVGLVGSRRKVHRLLQRIAARCGVPSLERLHAPVGLDIGAVTPQELAVSIVAELVALRRGRSHNAHLSIASDAGLAASLAEAGGGSGEVEAAESKRARSSRGSIRLGKVGS